MNFLILFKTIMVKKELQEYINIRGLEEKLHQLSLFHVKCVVVSVAMQMIQHTPVVVRIQMS